MRRLKRSATAEARSSQRATVLRGPVRRAVAEMLTPSTRRLATWSNSLPFHSSRTLAWSMPDSGRFSSFQCSGVKKNRLLYS